MVISVQPTHNFTYAGATLNVFHVNKGEGIPMHTHEYSHATTCMAGSCKYTQDGVEVIATKDTQPINLVAGKFHEIEALEDGTVFINVFEDGKR